MPSAPYRPFLNITLKNQVIVLTGGATGIGAATVRLLHDLGAHVVFGDINESSARTLVYELSRQNELNESESEQQAAQAGSNSNSGSGSGTDTGTGTGPNEQHTTTTSPSTHFLKCDVSNSADIKSLFESAWTRFGRVDHSISIAGITETGNWFELDGRGGSRLTRDKILDEEAPGLRTLEVNLVGTCYFARAALGYMNETVRVHHTEPAKHSLSLMASLNGFKAAGTNFAMYSASKHGVVGVGRVLCEYLGGANTSMGGQKTGMRVNWLMPFTTRSPMTGGLEESWERLNLPWNEAEDVARVVGDLVGDESARGMGLYVESGEAWDIEAALTKDEDEWWGRERREIYEKARKVLDGFI